MKLNDNEITELAKNYAGITTTNSIDDDERYFGSPIKLGKYDGFIEGFKKCQSMSDWVSVEQVLDLLNCTKEILKWHSDKETGLVAGHKLGGTPSFCSARSAIAKMELVLPTPPIR